MTHTHAPRWLTTVATLAAVVCLTRPAQAQGIQVAPPAQAPTIGFSTVRVAGARLWTESNDLNVLPGLLRSLCVGTAFGQGCPGGWEFGQALAGSETPSTVPNLGGEADGPGGLPANRYAYPRTSVMGEAATARPRNGAPSNGTQALAPRRPS